MKSLKKQRRIQVIAVMAVALTLSTVLIGYALQDGINFFRSPSQVAEEPPGPKEVFRIGGLVADGSLAERQRLEKQPNVTLEKSFRFAGHCLCSNRETKR